MLSRESSIDTVHLIPAAGVPLVDDHLAIQVDTNPVIRPRPESVHSGPQIDVAAPASGKPVLGQSHGDPAPPPIEVDFLVVPNQVRFAVHRLVRPVLTLPIADACIHFLPPHSNARLAAVLVVRDDNLVITTGESQILRHLPSRSIPPGVDQQPTVDPQARPVVHQHVETVRAGVKLGRARPTSGKVRVW